MTQKFKIPIYLILKSDKFDESNEASMIEYTFDKNLALDRLGNIATEFARDYSMSHQEKGKPYWPTVATIPDYCEDYSIYEVANYTLYLEERFIEV